MNRRPFAKRIVTALTAVIMAIQIPVQSISAHAASPKYVSEVFISYGNTEKEATDWLTQNGYKIINQNLNENAHGGLDMLSWMGLASEKRCVYLGYKTTNDPDEAITDMKIMNMNGGYNYEAYEKLLEDQKNEITLFVSDKICALNEYRENYNAGKTKALIAYDLLNRLSDDDCSDALLGDLLLKPTRQEMDEDSYQASPEDHADLVTILMQGNSYIEQLVMYELAYAADTASDSWLDRVCASGGYNEMVADLSADHPALNGDEIETKTIAEYDDAAKQLVASLSVLRTDMRCFTESGIDLDSTQEEIDAVLQTMNDQMREDWSEAAALYVGLNDHSYLGRPILEFLTDPSLDFLNDIKAREQLYPFIAAMSPGQVRLLNYISIKDMLKIASLDETGWQAVYAQKQEEQEDAETVSIYLGVDRTLFQPDGIALTNDAYRVKASEQIKSTSPGGKVAAFAAAALVADAILGSLIWLGYDTFSEDADYAKALPSSIAQTTDRLKNIAEETVSLQNEVIDLLPEKYAQEISQYEGRLAQLNYLMDPDKYNELMENGSDQLSDALENLNTRLQETDYDELAGDLAEYKTRTASAGLDARIFKVLGTVFCVAIFLITAAAGVYAVKEYCDYYHTDMKPIPQVMVSQVIDPDGRSSLTYYYAAKCNRNEVGMDNEKLNDLGDLNGDVMKQWLALYTTKDTRAGTPILASGFAAKKGNGSGTIPMGKSPLSLFGFETATNLVDTKYVYNDNVGGICIYYKHASGADTYTGTVTSNGTLALSSVISAIVGAAFAAAVIELKNRKKHGTAV